MVTIRSRRAVLLLWLLLALGKAWPQEVLVPIAHRPVAGGFALPGKATQSVLLPFFDDFSHYEGAPDSRWWATYDAYVNKGYAPLPPTIGVVTLDALDAQGELHFGAGTSPFSGDTLMSCAVRLDSVFSPNVRSLSPADSVFMSFYYLPGGGSGPMWQRNGDCPEANDSLVLEFYNPYLDSWEWVWSCNGVSVDTLIARTGTSWQYVILPIDKVDYFDSNFRFRFRNYCSLDEATKPGLLSNADQWNLDYIFIDCNRSSRDTFSRDVAFVTPAPSLLREYQSMPANQFSPSDMLQRLEISITNLYYQALATRYTYSVYSEMGSELYSYDGGYENAPSFLPNHVYQSAAAHAAPDVNYTFPADGTAQTYRVVHVVREGVSGDSHPENDTLVFNQVFDNYYAYDDGTPENGYGLSSTNSKVRFAVQFSLRTMDTLTAVDLYFNRTYREENSRSYFSIVIWADDGGKPGAIIYQDNNRRKPIFSSLNRYCRYPLESAVPVSGTIYVGLEQSTADYINLGFDRNNDVSDKIYYLTDAQWQTSILSGALMLRPYFGQRALAGLSTTADADFRAYSIGRDLCVNGAEGKRIIVYDLMGRSIACISRASALCRVRVPRSGVYLVRVGDGKAAKVPIY